MEAKMLAMWVHVQRHCTSQWMLPFFPLLVGFPVLSETVTGNGMLN